MTTVPPFAPPLFLQVFDNGYDLLPQSIVDIWLSDNELDVAVQAGHQVVASFGYYLDQQTPDGPTHYFWADTVRSGVWPYMSTAHVPRDSR